MTGTDLKVLTWHSVGRTIGIEIESDDKAWTIRDHPTLFHGWIMYRNVDQQRYWADGGNLWGLMELAQRTVDDEFREQEG